MKIREFKKPIFVVGCTNSGTKCLFHVLKEHPELGAMEKELHYYGFQPNIDGRINRLFSLWPCFKSNYMDSWIRRSHDGGPINGEEVRILISMIMEHLEKEKGKEKEEKRLLIKEPKLSLRIKWLKLIFPDCYIIGIVRNPWAVIEGIKRKTAMMGDVPLNLDTPTATAQWNITNNIILMDSEGIENFQLVKYEDMIEADSFPEELESNSFWTRVLHHAGLPIDGFRIPNESKYSHFEKDRNEGSVKRLEQWDIDYINLACSSLIKKFGYKKPVKENNG